MCSSLTVVADGVELTLPLGTEGIIILNIASYGGGSDLWGSSEQMDGGVSDLWNAEEYAQQQAAGGGQRQTAHGSAPAALDSADGAWQFGNSMRRLPSMENLPRMPRSHSRSAVSAPAAASRHTHGSHNHHGGGGGGGGGSNHSAACGSCAAACGSRHSSRHGSRDGSRDYTDTDTSEADEWDATMYDASDKSGSQGFASQGFLRPSPVSVSSVGSDGVGGGSTSATSSRRGGATYYGPKRISTPPSEGFVPASMDDCVLEVSMHACCSPHCLPASLLRPSIRAHPFRSSLSRACCSSDSPKCPCLTLGASASAPR